MKEGMDQYSVTIMFRTALFSYNRSRLRNASPHPANFFSCLAESFWATLAHTKWELPSLDVCRAAANIAVWESPAIASTPQASSEGESKEPSATKRRRRVT